MSIGIHNTINNTTNNINNHPSTIMSQSTTAAAAASGPSIYEGQHTPIKQIARSALSNVAGMNGLWTGADEDDDEDDEPLEVPKFHFDWLSEEDKQRSQNDTGTTGSDTAGDGHRREGSSSSTSGRASGSSSNSTTLTAVPVVRSTLISLGKPSRAPRSSSSNSISDPSHLTPPQYGLSKSTSTGTGSAHSSASSARVASLTDASTISGSSVPTPPYAGSHHSRTSLSSYGSGGSGSGESGGRPAARTYSSRPFQRHVSAPLARDRFMPDEHSIKDTADLSTSTSHTHTATLRPMLTQTNSASSIHDSVNNTATRPTARTNFVTPGMKERATPFGTAGSTTRRLGGLSRFGGPARRVTQAEAEALAAQEEQNSPVLMPSPPRTSRMSPPPETPVAGPSTQKPKSPEILPPSRRRSPPMARRHVAAPSIPEDVEYLDSEYEPERHRATSPAVFETRQDDYRARQPLRPYHSENLPSTHHRSESKTERPDFRPNLPPTHRPPDSSPPSHPQRNSPPSRHEYPYKPTPAPVPAPAPSHAPLQSESRLQTQTAPQPAVSEPSRQAPAPPPADPTAAINSNKRLFCVNGAYYERVGMLGKGGSSKVYSVLCSTKRTILALKRVILDRADPETYQSYTNEIELLKRLRGHDRIIQLVDHQITFSPNNRPKVLVMVMECGEIDFAMLLDEQRGKPLNFNFVGLYWQQMLQAVEAVHQENVVHTDLKPANFVLVKGRLKIIDFGIAKAIANDTVNIQRDQQIGTVNYMSPEAISKMTNLNVLKLSYPSDVWSLGCILYQMVYGSPPFQHIQGGPLSKMNVIANPAHRIDYPDTAVPRGATGIQGEAVDPATMAVKVMPSAIDSMKSCLAYNKEERLTIPALLEHEFLQPRLEKPLLPRGKTTITREQMNMMVAHLLNNGGQVDADHIGDDLFDQLVQQNQ